MMALSLSRYLSLLFSLFSLALSPPPSLLPHYVAVHNCALQPKASAIIAVSVDAPITLCPPECARGNLMLEAAPSMFSRNGNQTAVCNC